MPRKDHTLTCSECGCQYGGADPEPIDTLCTNCRWKKDRLEEIHYLESLLSTARHHVTMGRSRETREALKEVEKELKSIIHYLR